MGEKKNSGKFNGFACGRCGKRGHKRSECPKMPNTAAMAQEHHELSTTQAQGDSQVLGNQLKEEGHDEQVRRHLQLCRGPGNDIRKPSHNGQNERHVLKTTPVFSNKVKTHTTTSDGDSDLSLFTKRGLLGRRKQPYQNSGARADSRKKDNLIYSNTSAPWSAFTCGQQGAGKSYTLSCLLENALT